jgi:hypothetical protein
MSGKNHVVSFTVIVSLTMAIVFIGAVSADAYRICTFKGTVVDNGWRTMTVKSNGQCAEVNVGWRTKYVPNRRPCLGEVVAVDFTLEDGYMKATKVVSLTPTPPSMQCFPPAPPASSVCRTVGENGSSSSSTLDSCVPPKPVFSTKPPAHVTDRNWSPDKKEVAPRDVSPRPPSAKAPPKTSKAEPSVVPPPSRKPVTKQEAPAEKKVITKTSPPPEKVKPEVRDEVKEEPVQEEKIVKTLMGEVVASSPKSLSVRNSGEGDAAEVLNIRVGLKTKFIPFRRPAVGEKVKVDYRVENGEKFGYTVQVVQ